MKLSKEDYEYLSGEKFSNGYKMALANNPLYSRIERIVMLAREKNVLHIGCCDHIPLVEAKIRQHRWLHGLLEENCNEVLGIDINEKAVNYINKNHLSKQKVYCADITSKKWKELIPKRNFDMVLFGEIIEHVDNPVRFLGAAKKVLKDYGFYGEYVITVPNAYSFLRDARNLKIRGGVECINSDHRYWFTPFTISKVMLQAKIRPEEIFFASDGLGGNGKNKYTEKMFVYLEKKRGCPSSYKSYRADQLIVVDR